MRVTKSALVASVACAIAAPAIAADLSGQPYYYKAPAPIGAAVFSWTGFYVGGNVGAKWGRFDETVTAAPAFPAGTVAFPTAESDTSAVGGGQIGYMWQAGQWVLGIEGDIDSARLRSSVTTGTGVPAPFLAGDTIGLRNDWQGSVRGRVGWAFDRVLIYATGGGSWANLKTTGTFLPVGTTPGLTTSRDETLFGWTAGGGVDFAITGGWSIGGEYRFTRYDRDNTFALGALPISATTTTPISTTTNLDTHEVTARLNYHFGGGPF